MGGALRSKVIIVQFTFKAHNSSVTLTSSFKYWSTIVMKTSYSICYHVMKNQYSIRIKWATLFMIFWIDWEKVNRCEFQFSYQSFMCETSFSIRMGGFWQGREGEICAFFCTSICIYKSNSEVKHHICFEKEKLSKPSFSGLINGVRESDICKSSI